MTWERLHRHRAVDLQQRTELVLYDSANVRTAHLSEGRDSFWEESIKFEGGGSFFYACFIVYTCLLLWLLIIRDTRYSANGTETLVISPMYDDDDDATSDFPSLLQ